MILRLLLAIICAVGFASCGSPGGQNYFCTGKDARVFNPITGRYEWPDDSQR